MFTLNRSLFWLCCAAVLALALLPPVSVPIIPSTGWDKSNHVLAFAVMAGLGFRAYPDRVWWVLAGLLAYGLGLEVAQSLTPTRQAEWADVLADVVGLVLAWGAWVGRIMLGAVRLRGPHNKEKMKC